MVHQLSKRTIEYIAARSNQDIDQDQLDVYIYGLECFINTAVPVVLLTIFSILHNSLFETWLWIFAFTLLRKYTGGYHAPTQFTCMAFSTCLGIGNTLAIQHLTFHWIPAAIMYFLCMGVAAILCPMKSSKKELSNAQRMHYMYYILGIMVFFFFISLFLPTSFSITLAYSLVCCMLLVVIELLHKKVLFSQAQKA